MAGRGRTHHGQTIARQEAAGRSSRRKAWLTVLTVGTGVVLFLVGGLGLHGWSGRTSPDRAAVGGFGPAPAGARALEARITGLQERQRRVPEDHVSWASLGLAYVEQARISVDPTYYPKAVRALERSLAIDPADNFAACAGMAALASARHDFADAREWALKGLSINPANATLHGALGDAEIQLGRYTEAFESIQRMVDLLPDTGSLARASYAWELRGDVDQARSLMRRALDIAPTAADRAFARYHLGELAFNAGDPAAALAEHELGLRADASFVANLAGRARAEAALGRTDEAVADYTRAVERVPQLSFVLELGELLESLGQVEQAQRQYQLFTTVEELFVGNGVALDVDAVLFDADHGDRRRALEAAGEGIRKRPFLDMHDAYAWALHVNGRHAEARERSQAALALGTRNALFHFHAGMIEEALGDAFAARAHLAEALAINAGFSPRWAPVARQTLDRLGGVV